MLADLRARLAFRILDLGELELRLLLQLVDLLAAKRAASTEG